MESLDGISKHRALIRPIIVLWNTIATYFLLQFCYTFFLPLLSCFVHLWIIALLPCFLPCPDPLFPCPVALLPCSDPHSDPCHVLLYAAQRLPLQLLIVFDCPNTTKTGIQRYIMHASRYYGLWLGLKLSPTTANYRKLQYIMHASRYRPLPSAMAIPTLGYLPLLVLAYIMHASRCPALLALLLPLLYIPKFSQNHYQRAKTRHSRRQTNITRVSK